MKIVLQRVKKATVTVDEKVVGQIGKGYLILLGIGKEDTKETVDKYLDKIIKMRIFEDENGKTNLSLGDVGGEILLVSQFTLYADCKKGNRPSFIKSADPSYATELYNYALEVIKKQIGKVEAGIFGEDMDVMLINDGPFTIMLDENSF